MTTGRSATIARRFTTRIGLDTIARRDGGFASAVERPAVAYRRVWRRMRVTCLHGGWLASLPEALRDELITALTPAQARALLYEWLFWARPNQLPPEGNWRVWLLLAGRGFGKTRTGAEMIRPARWHERRAGLRLWHPQPAMRAMS